MQIILGTPAELAEFVSKQRACVDEDKIKKLEEITNNYVKTMCNPKALGDFTESLRKQMIEHKDNPIDFGGDDDDAD